MKSLPERGGGDYGFPFQLGETYLIYSYIQNTYFEQGEKVLNYLYTNICTRTTSDFTKESAAIKKGNKTVQKDIVKNVVELR